MTAVVAVCENGGIGKDGALLFHIREDLRRFRQLTLGKTVVMGRKTLESLPGGRGLPDRRNLVIGGESVYRQLLPRCGTVYVTKIFASPQADAFFPDLSRDSGWTEAERSEMYTSGGVRFQYVTYRRR